MLRSLGDGTASRLRHRANKRKNLSFALSASGGAPSELRRGMAFLLHLHQEEARFDRSELLTVAALWLLAKRDEASLAAGRRGDRVSLSSVPFRRPAVRRWVLRQNRSFPRFLPASVSHSLWRRLEKEMPEPLGGDGLDFLGHAYQTLLSAGAKSRGGTFFTPDRIVGRIANDHAGNRGHLLDPCCGTGQYLLGFAKTSDLSMERLCGIDFAPMAAFLCGLRLLLAFPRSSTPPAIFCANFLSEKDMRNRIPGFAHLHESFDLVATNPPWGNVTKTFPVDDFPMLESNESFSRFVVQSLRFVRSGGKLSFLLPESFGHVRTHGDLRKHLLENTRLVSIERLGPIFRGVMTPVYRVDLQKSLPGTDTRIAFLGPTERSYLPQSRFLKEPHRRLPAHLRPDEWELLQELLSHPHSPLGENADWALGIVTGDNRKHLRSIPGKDDEPIYRGSDVQPFFLSRAEHYIAFRPERFQQVAPESKYRVAEKLIYRFVSRRLVVAWDDRQSLTLNSANLCLPSHPDLSPRALTAYLNSRIAQFLLQAQCNALKILRHDLEALPIFHFLAECEASLSEATAQGHRLTRPEESRRLQETIDRLLYRRFGLNESQQAVMSGFLGRILGKKPTA